MMIIAHVSREATVSIDLEQKTFLLILERENVSEVSFSSSREMHEEIFPLIFLERQKICQ